MELPGGETMLKQNGSAKSNLKYVSRITENTKEMIERRKEQKILWHHVLIATAAHLYFVYSLAFLLNQKWQTVLWSVLMFHAGKIGQLAGAHRLWSHRSYTATMPLKIILMIFYSIEGTFRVPIYDWARDHRVHHRYTETDIDPYSAERGFFYSQIGWLLMMRHPDSVKKRRELDIEDILKDPVCMFERKYHYALSFVMCIVMPICVPVMWWGESWHIAAKMNLVRWVISIHTLGTINSLAHMFGSKPFNKSIFAAQNWFVSVVTIGEGWHNYHHMFPWDYRASDFGLLNTSMHFIRFCNAVGLAYDLKTANPELVRNVMMKYGDGSHPDWIPNGPEIPVEALNDAEFELPNPSFKKHM